MYHFVYKTSLENSNKYYIGRKSTSSENFDPWYFGSGRWVKSIQDKSKFKREILAFTDSSDKLIDLEYKLIKENINNPNCMNFTDAARGSAVGKFNPMKNPEVVKNHKGTFKKGYISPWIGTEDQKNYIIKRMTENNPMKNKKSINNFAESRAHNWIITLPTGEVNTIRNLRKYCKKHSISYPKLFKAGQMGYKTRDGYQVKGAN